MDKFYYDAIRKWHEVERCRFFAHTDTWGQDTGKLWIEDPHTGELYTYGSDYRRAAEDLGVVVPRFLPIDQG